MQPSRLFRTPVARGFAKDDSPDIRREAGVYRAGLIEGAAILSRGEVQTHGVWVDTVMLRQAVTAIDGKPQGIKSRFMHPGISGDGLGRVLGRYRDPRLDGDIVRADLHIFETAHDTPDGNLAAYIMNLAEEDPTVFGNSIAFEPNELAERNFMHEHSTDGEFHSPDDDNPRNYPHARIGALEAVDVVDAPASNPEGLFHRGDEIAADAVRLIRYALKLDDLRPELVRWGLAPERVRDFTQRFLSDAELMIIPRWEYQALLRRAENGKLAI